MTGVQRITLVAVAASVFAAAAALYAPRAVEAGGKTTAHVAEPAYLTAEATLDHWDAEGAAGVPKVRRHAWKLFEYMVLETDAPRWSQWETEAEVVASLPGCANGVPASGKAALPPAAVTASPAQRLIKNLHTPEQLLVGASAERKAAIAQASQPEFSFVAINPPTAAYLRRMMIDTKTCSLQAALERQVTHPLVPDRDGNRKVPELPRTSVVIKAIWELVSGPANPKSTLVPLHVWDPANPQLATGQTDETTAPLSHWKSTVQLNIDVTPTAPKCDPTADYGKAPVPMACFFSVPIAKEDVNSFESQSQNVVIDPLQPNNAPFNLVLIGFHVMTRETKNWTWQTYYWSNKAFAPDAAGVARSGDLARHDGNPWKKTGAAQWSHYVMDTTLSTTSPAEPDGKAKICYDPYLEGARPHGMQSNCIGCHQYARYNPVPAQAAGYVLAEQARTDTPPTKAQIDAYKAKSLDTSFLWSLAETNRPH